MRLEEVYRLEVPEGVYCPQCGYKDHDGAAGSYCPSCGTELEEGE